MIKGLLPVFLISNTIRITIIARGDEIEIMKLVGATNSFVRLPFLLEGMWLGMFGALIPMGLTAFLYKQLYDFVTPRVSGDLIELVKPGAITLEVAGLLLLLAVVIGVVGSFMSVRKFLRV